MGNYTPNPSMTQPIYDPTRPFATPNYDVPKRFGVFQDQLKAFAKEEFE